MRAQEFITEYRKNAMVGGIDLSFEYDDKFGESARVQAFSNGRKLGYAEFLVVKDNELEATDLEVDERYRGQGIARLMYDFVKQQGYKIHRSHAQTTDGHAFWNKNRGEERVWEQELSEISRDRLERYLDRAGRQVDTRQERMARARQRLNTNYEIYHAEEPTKIVDRFEADTPADAQRYYQNYIERYESDWDYDLRLRRGTGIMEFAPSPDRDNNDDIPDPIFVLANRWWNAAEKQPQIESVLNSMGWSIQQVESEDDAVQLQHRDGTTYFISADDFDPDLFENFADGIRAYHGNQGGIDTEQLHAPMWFTDSRPDAEYYAGDDGYVVVVNLDIQNPYVLQPGEEANSVLRRWQELQAQGYDGIYDRRLGDWIPFSRKQIRVISKDDTFMGENFADGKKPGRKGLSKRVGIPKKATLAQLQKIASSSTGERRRMAQWQLNMRRGKAKKNK